MTGRPFPRIVVPLDGSAGSESALGPAAEVARLAGVPVTLLQVTADESESPAAGEYLEKVAAALAAPDLTADVSVLVAARDLLPVTIVGDAARDNALICLATQGRSGIAQSVLGSVAAEALRLSANPLLLAGPALDTGRRLADGPVVACLDGSTFAEAVLPAAKEWASTFGLGLHLVRVRDAGDGTADDVQISLEKAAGRAGGTCEVLPGPDVAGQLVEMARQEPVGLLALATHGRSGQRQAVLGSVAMSVVRHAPCPVLVARSRTLTDGL